MIQTVSRRRFLAISAAGCALPGAVRANAPALRWRGTALGAEATILLAGVEECAVRGLFSAVEAELARIERLFSLYRSDSQLSRLNGDGALDEPAAEFVALLRLAGALNRATGGAFDPTVQPLWRLHAGAAAESRRPDDTEIAATLRATGWRHVRLSRDRVAFARPGMALTLNGIAQGHAADRVADLLRGLGLRDILVDIGEIAATGRRPDGTPWRAGIALPDGRPVRQVALADRALATSAPLGSPLDADGRIGHIVDPRTGRPGGQWRLVSVRAPRAALADGLSTAFCLMPRPAIDAALARHPGAALEALI